MMLARVVAVARMFLLIVAFLDSARAFSFAYQQQLQLPQQLRPQSARTPSSFALSSTQRRLASSVLLNAAATATIKLEGRKIQGQVQPLNNFLLVKVVAAQEKTEGGILLTGKAKIQKTQGSVVAVGPGRTHADSGIPIPVPIKVGDGVVYGKYDGTEIEYDDAKHTLIRDDDVLVTFAGGEELSLENVQVIRDNVLVKVNVKEQTTEGGILIAKTTEKRPSTGEVITVGPGRIASNGELMPMEVSPGDEVKFRDFAGNEVEIDGEEYSVVKMADILAKF